MTHLRLVKSDTGPSLDTLRGYKWIYFAQPYTSHPIDTDQAYHDGGILLDQLRAQGLLNLYSPVSMWHGPAQTCELPKAHEYWESENGHKLSQCCALLIAKLPGWQKSEGILWEAQIMRNLRRPIYYIDPITMVLS